MLKPGVNLGAPGGKQFLLNQFLICLGDCFWILVDQSTYSFVNRKSCNFVHVINFPVSLLYFKMSSSLLVRLIILCHLSRCLLWITTTYPIMDITWRHYCWWIEWLGYVIVSRIVHWWYSISTGQFRNASWSENAYYGVTGKEFLTFYDKKQECSKVWRMRYCVWIHLENTDVAIGNG